MKACWEDETWLHVFLISILDKCNWAASHLGRFNARRNGPVLVLTGGLMNPRAKRDTLEKKEMYSHPPPGRQNPASNILQSERAFRSYKM